MISGETSLVGLLGNPVSHSLSPVIHNAALKEMGLDWCYVAMSCESQNLSIVTKALRELNYQGLNITIPHKQNILKICNQISPLAQKLGAVNTLVPNKDGGWNGLNTDVEGFLAPLKTDDWSKKKAIILGCGGSARAVFAGLQDLNFEQITVVGRKQNTLKNFVIEMNPKDSEHNNNSTLIKGLLTDEKELILEIKNASLIVNTTPVGMSSKKNSTKFSQEIPLEKNIWQHLQPETTLYDLIYTPRPTAWLNLGAKNGCKQIDGLEMLVQQGAASLKIWSNNDEVPIDVMRTAAKNYLNH